MPPKQPRLHYSEATIHDAIFDITDHGLLIRESSSKWGVPRSIIQSRLNGQGAIRDQIQPYLLISKDDEARLVPWILYQEDLSYSPSHSQICGCVISLLQQRCLNPKIGKHWVARFIQRYPEIKTKPGRRQEANRFDSFTARAVHWYFDIREKEYGWIKPENTFNIDEGGIMAGFGMSYFLSGHIYLSITNIYLSST